MVSKLALSWKLIRYSKEIKNYVILFKNLMKNYFRKIENIFRNWRTNTKKRWTD